MVGKIQPHHRFPPSQRATEPISARTPIPPRPHQFCGRRFYPLSSSSLRMKRPDLSGRPPCKGMAIGVARTGARLGGERTLRDPVSHAGGPHVVSSVITGRSCARACVRAGLARRAANGKRKKAGQRGAEGETRKVSCACCEAEEPESGAAARVPVRVQQHRSCAKKEGCGSVCVRELRVFLCACNDSGPV